MTEKQIRLIKLMNQFCAEKFDLSHTKTKEEARDYINRNIDEYKQLTGRLKTWMKNAMQELHRKQ